MKIQNNVSVYTGVVLEDDVFCGPSMVFTNVVLLATMGVESLWSASILNGAWTLVTQARVTRSSVPLVALGAGALLVGKVDRVRQWRIVAVCLLVLMPLQFWFFW